MKRNSIRNVQQQQRTRIESMSYCRMQLMHLINMIGVALRMSVSVLSQRSQAYTENQFKQHIG